MKRLFYETEPCKRCCGSGWYSYCELYGHTCFDCMVIPKAQGSGRRFTKAAKESQAAVAAFVRERFTRRADEVRPGMWIIPVGSRTPVEVIGVRNPGSSGHKNQDGSVTWGVDLQTKRMTYCHQHGWGVQVIPSEQEWESIVLPFVRTLPAVTVEGDTPVGVYRLITGRNRRVEYVGRWGAVAGAIGFISQQGPKVRRRMFVAPIEHDAGRAKAWAA